MIPTLIALAIIFLSITGILSISATFTVIYDGKWTTTVKVLWYEREIKLSSIINFILFPDKAAHDARTKQAEKSAQKQETVKKAETKPVVNKSAENKSAENKSVENKSAEQKPVNAPQPKTEKTGNTPAKKEAKPNYLQKLFEEDGIVGILLLISNMFQTASSAINTLFRGFHIYSLYVKMIIGGGDAADVAQTYGSICSYYYPVKGVILNGMTVDEYDELFVPDFIAPRSEYGLQLIGSISIRLLLRMGFSAVKTFLVNMIQNNKNNK